MPGLTRETAWIQNSMTSMILSLSLLQGNLVASALLLVSVWSSNMASCHRSMGLMLRLWEMNSLMRWEPEMMNGWLVWTEQHDAVVDWLSDVCKTCSWQTQQVLFPIISVDRNWKSDHYYNTFLTCLLMKAASHTTMYSHTFIHSPTESAQSCLISSWLASAPCSEC